MNPKQVSIHGEYGVPSTPWDADATAVHISVHHTLDQTNVLAPSTGVTDGQVVYLYAPEGATVYSGGSTFSIPSSEVVPLIRIDGSWVR